MVLLRAGGDESGYLFVARSDSVRTLYNILKAIQFRERATICATDKGLKVTVEDTKCVQANAFLQSDLFSQYQLKEDNVNFCVSLPVLCECLNIFGSHSGISTLTTVKMSYATHGAPLKLLLEEGGIVTDCSIRTYDPDEIMDFEFSLTSIAAKIIMKAEPIRETFNDLDSSSEYMEICVQPDKGIRFSTVGTHCTSETAILKESEFVEVFTCTQKLSHKYRISLLKPSARALHLATKVSIRIDDRGFFSMQYMIEHEGQVIFIEFFCSPQEDELPETQSTF